MAIYGRAPRRGAPIAMWLALLCAMPVFAGEAEPSTEEPTEARDAAENPRQPEDEKQEPLPAGIVEEVIVHGDLAQERLTPATFTDLDREEIAFRHHAQDLGMLLGDTPNAYAYSDAGNGVGYSYLSLRGFDQRRIAVQINGIPINTPEAHAVYYIDLADFADSLDSIQVQRGTGTALFGSPAVGGVVNLETGHLRTTEGGELRLGQGSFGTRRVAFRYGGPLAGGRWAWMARVARVRSDGYRTLSWTRHAFHHLALERFGPTSLLRINLFGGPERTQLAYFGVPKSWLEGGVTGDADRDRRLNPLLPGESDSFVQPHLQVLHDWHLREGLFLKNTLYAIQGRGFFQQYAASFCYDPQVTVQAGSPCPSEREVKDAWRRRWIRERQLGWIPRLTWDHARGSLTAGAQILVHGGRHQGSLYEGMLDGQPVASSLPVYDYWNYKRSYSLFVRESLRPAENLALSLELQGMTHRFSMRKDRMRGLSWDADYSFLTPRVGINWNFTDRWNLYGSASTARSEPAFNQVFNPEDTTFSPSSVFGRFDPGLGRYSDPVARPEKLRDYELGIGYVLGATRFKANVYRMEFQDELVFAGGIDPDGLPITDNAGRSVHEGIELEGGGKLPGQVDVSGHLTMSRDVLRDYRLVLGPDPSQVVDYSGNRVALFPDHLARVRIGRRFGPARLVLGARRVGTIHLDNSENERKNPSARLESSYVEKKIGPFTLVDLEGTVDVSPLLGSGRTTLSLDLHVDNLLNKRYTAFGYSYPNPYGAEIPGWCSPSFCSEFIPGATRSVFLGLAYGF